MKNLPVDPERVNSKIRNGTHIWQDRRWVAKLGRVPLCKQTLRQRFVCEKFVGDSFTPNSVKEVDGQRENLYCVEVVTGVLTNPVGALKPEWPAFQAVHN